MKVLHVLYQSLPDISGSSTRSDLLLQALKNKGLYIEAITSPFQKGMKNDSDIINGVIYNRTFNGDLNHVIGMKKGFLKRLLKLKDLVSFALHCRSKFIKDGFDIVHAHGNFFAGLCGVYIKYTSNARFVYEVRSDWVENSNFSASRLLKFFFGYIEKFIITRADHVVVISNGLFDKYRVFNQKISVVGNAIDISLINEKEYFRIKPSLLTIGYIGSVLELEGLDYLIDAVKNDYRFTLRIAGTGSAFESIKTKISAENIGNVCLLGKIGRELVPDFYNQVDLIVNYRRNESVANSVTPLKPLEAMQFGKPVVVSNVGGMLELIINNYNGIVVNSDSVSELRAVLVEIFDGTVDLSTIVNNSFSYLRRNRSWEANADNYIRIYNELKQI